MVDEGHSICTVTVADIQMQEVQPGVPDIFITYRLNKILGFVTY